MGFIWAYFNSRPREGGDQVYYNWRSGKEISIRAPARGATPECYCVEDFCTISIRAPARGATPDKRRQNPGDEYFNSRPREGGDGDILYEYHCGIYISIRAPARGATAKIHKSREFMLLNDSFVL